MMEQKMMSQPPTSMTNFSHADPLIANHSPPLSTMHNTISNDMFNFGGDQQQGMTEDGYVLSEMYAKHHINHFHDGPSFDFSINAISESQSPLAGDMQGFDMSQTTSAWHGYYNDLWRLVGMAFGRFFYVLVTYFMISFAVFLFFLLLRLPLPTGWRDFLVRHRLGGVPCYGLLHSSLRPVCSVGLGPFFPFWYLGWSSIANVCTFRLSSLLDMFYSHFKIPIFFIYHLFFIFTFVWNGLSLTSACQLHFFCRPH